jgi:mannose-1-phosphate guanylyltransferase
MIKTAVIIAGGEGSRLRPLTDNLPKALAPLNGQPMLFWVIRWLKEQGVNRIVLGVAYRKEKIYEFMNQHDNFGLQVSFSEHTLEGGTAQGFKLAITRYVHDDRFIAMNCDEITNLRIGHMASVQQETNPLIVMALAPFHCRFSVVDVDEKGLISGFQYGKKIPNALVSIGIYIFSAEVAGLIPDTGSIEDALFARLAQEGRIAAYQLNGHEEWISVNDIKNVKEAETFLNRMYAAE